MAQSAAVATNWLKRILTRRDTSDRAAREFLRGTALLKAKRAREAVGALRAGLVRQPDHAEMRYNLAAALMQLEEYEAARAELALLVETAPRLAQAHSSFAYIERQLGRIEEALASYRKALELAPDDADTHSNLLLTLNYSARHTPAEVFAEHVRFGERHATAAVGPPPESAWPRRLRVGYVSPDLRSHVVSCFMLPILARHDRERFEVFCYYTHPVGDEVTDAARALADRWLQCAAYTDAELACRVRADRIDLLIDLAGHMAYQRLKTFALKPAPLQAAYLGYPNTTGLQAIDYRITDAVADPPGASEGHHIEQLVRLPRSFLCYRPGADLHAVTPLPAAATHAVTFGCFSNFQKLSPPFFAAAARILRAVPGSRLLLKAKPLALESVAKAVLERFAQAGIDPARITLRGWEPTVEQHLARYAMIDIALDSFPYNGTTTTCEAMWMGVPVVTLRGERHAARVGATLLHAVGLDELVADDEDEFVGVAARLATDLPRLAMLRRGLRQRLRGSPLMDEAGFVGELEASYLEMWQRKLRGPCRYGGLKHARDLRHAGRFADAKAACAEALTREPASVEAAVLLWELCGMTSDHAGAVEWLRRAVSVDGCNPRLHYMLACAEEDLGETAQAMVSYRRTLELDPCHAKAANNLGCLLEAGGDLAAARAYYEQAARADPALAQARYNLGNLHKQLGEDAAAARLLREALEMEPAHPDWHCNLAGSLLLDWRLDEAAESFRAALQIDPRYAAAHIGLANALHAMGQVPDAQSALGCALEAKPDSAEAHSNMLYGLHYLRGDDAAGLYEEHLKWAARHTSGLEPAPRGGVAARRPLRIGYVSPNFHRHSVAFFLEPLLAAHDRAQVQVFCYANVARPDETTRRLQGLCDAWRDIGRLSDDQTARLIREDGIDILVDLAGHTGGGRLLVFARRPAPVQVAWLGYPNTSGLATMDYRLTDADADPPGETDASYSEKLVRLPGGFLCYAPPREAPAVAPPPCLQSGRVSFGCFNNLAKLTPGMIRLWARLLAAVPGARLVIKAQALRAASARGSLAERFLAEGVAASSLVLFAGEPAVGAHLGRYAEIDIALDSFPYNGTTTTCEALWMGVPVVTLAGKTHVSRVGASILNRVGLPELVAPSPDEYLQRALALAREPRRLSELRMQMRARMETSPLLDAAGFARAVENAYRYCAR